MDVRTLCLGVLARGDATGYGIRKAFEEGPFAHFQTAAFGSIYPALKGLAADGLVVERDPGAQNASPRPEKKTYRITAEGLAALDVALTEPPGPDRLRSDFCFILYFAERLPRAQVRSVLEARIAELRQRVTELTAAEAPGCATRSPGEAFICGLGLAHYRAVLAYLETHKDELIAAAPPADPADLPTGGHQPGQPLAPSGRA